MTLALYSIFALPLWAAMFALYFILRRHKLLRQSLIAKCAGSFLSAASAAFALYTRGEDPSARFILLFFLLCTLADALLEISFLPGMALFAVAHVCLILVLWRAYPPTLWTALVWAAAIIAALILFRRELPRMGVTAVPCCLYVGILSGTLALCLPTPFLQGGLGCWCLAVGALCFFISDLMVAKSEFSGLGDKHQKLIMLLYWAALYLISAALWS